MKINKYLEPNLTEKYIDFYYPKEDAETAEIVNYLSSYKNTLYGRNNEEAKILPIHSIYYFEIVERKCYAYQKDSVWQVDTLLQSILESYGNAGFVRISKSMVINIYKIRMLKADINMRVNILLDNDESVILNRTYKNAFFKYLKQLRKEAF